MDRTWIPGNRRRLTRRVVIGTWVAAVATAGVAAVRSALPGDQPASAAAPSGRPTPSSKPAPVHADDWNGSYLQFIAHPDDDLYFMNPPLQRSIAQGAPVVTVVLTAAEADGRNVENDSQNDPAILIDQPGYAEARHNGLRAAYALMATGDAHAQWRREVVKLTGGALVELCTLAQRPSVQLYFFNLAQNLRGVDRTSDGTYVRLRVLWSGDVSAESTLPGTGAPIKQPQEFTRGQVISCLVELLKKHRPTVVRTMDPDPEHDLHQPLLTLADHIDHTATAQFAIAALTEYTTAGDARPAVEYYRGYTSKFWPPNISAHTLEEKRGYLLPYAGLEVGSCPAHDCGDYQLGQDPARTTHIVSTAYRHAPTTDWLVRDGDGRLHAFAVLGGRVAHWAEQTPGGPDWREPELLASTDWMLPRVQVLADPKGLIHLVGLRRSTGDHGTVGIEVVHTAQQKSDGPFGPWESLGGPDFGTSDQRVRREIGVPAAAFDSSGRLHVYVRNFSQGLSHCGQLEAGGWGGWDFLASGPLQDAPTALTTKAGAVHVFAPDASGVQWFRQEAPGGRLLQTRINTGTPVAGAVTPVESATGLLTLYYREGGTAAVMSLRLPARPKDSQPRPVKLGGHDGTGEVAALAAPPNGDGALVVHRNGWGSLSAAAPPGTANAAATWTDTGGPLVFAPALARDRDGRAVAAVIGTDGRLHVARQPSTDPGGVIHDWLTV